MQKTVFDGVSFHMIFQTIFCMPFFLLRTLCMSKPLQMERSLLKLTSCLQYYIHCIQRSTESGRSCADWTFQGTDEADRMAFPFPILFLCSLTIVRLPATLPSCLNTNLPTYARLQMHTHTHTYISLPIRFSYFKSSHCSCAGIINSLL
jgi:hypothetical protein